MADKSELSKIKKKFRENKSRIKKKLVAQQIRQKFTSKCIACENPMKICRVFIEAFHSILYVKESFFISRFLAKNQEPTVVEEKQTVAESDQLEENCPVNGAQGLEPSGG